MDFRKEYIKSELSPNDLPLSFGDCGILDNINDQWREKSKAYGMFNDKGYIFGYTYHFGLDHIAIRNEIMEIIGDPHYLIAVDRFEDKLSIFMCPAHNLTEEPTIFEKTLIKTILLEAKEALTTRPEYTRMQLDLDLPVFIDIDFTRSTTIEDLEKQIALLNITEE